MKVAYVLLFVSLISLYGCVPPTPSKQSLINEAITSSPSEATIHWGKDRYNLQRTDHMTPFHKTIAGDKIESWCYRVTKEGFYDSEIICRPDETSSRFVNFELKRIELLEDNTVSITGAASALRKMTTSETHEVYPRLSPDKKWLLMQVYEAGENASYKSVLQKLNIENSSRIILTQKNNNSGHGTWFPDNSAIIFDTDKLGFSTIVQSLGISGEAAVKFITPPSFSPAIQPDVSPDGKQITFSLFHSDDDNQICVIKVDGSNLRVYGDGYEPRWSPDGKKIVFTRKVGKYTRIYTMESEAGANLVELSSIEANDSNASWSPNGKQIVFISDRTNGRKHLFLMDVNGQNIVQLTDGNFDVYSEDWGRDDYIYFSSKIRRNLDIWRLRVNP